MQLPTNYDIFADIPSDVDDEDDDDANDRSIEDDITTEEGRNKHIG